MEIVTSEEQLTKILKELFIYYQGECLVKCTNGYDDHEEIMAVLEDSYEDFIGDVFYLLEKENKHE